MSLTNRLNYLISFYVSLKAQYQKKKDAASSTKYIESTTRNITSDKLNPSHRQGINKYKTVQKRDIQISLQLINVLT